MESDQSRTYSANVPQEGSNRDELFMQHSLLFADNLKDLKNIRKQLYSAAEYFELSYCKDNQKQLVVETLKDYISKAIVSTVDHLGSVACKVNNFLDEKVDEFSGAELRFSCIEQRSRTWQEFIHGSGLSQHSFLIKPPKHHKQYVIPETKHVIGEIESIYANCSPSAELLSHQPKSAVQATIMKPPPPLARKGVSRLPSHGASSSPANFSFARVASSKEPERRAISPLRFPLKRSGTLLSSSSVIPSSSNAAIQRYPSQPQRSISLTTNFERDSIKDIQLFSKKSKPLFKVLVSMVKQKKDGGLHRDTDRN